MRRRPRPSLFALLPKPSRFGLRTQSFGLALVLATGGIALAQPKPTSAPGANAQSVEDRSTDRMSWGELRDEVERLRARVQQLELESEQCRQDAARTSADPAPGGLGVGGRPVPVDPAEADPNAAGAAAAPGARRDGLDSTGITLAEKLEFLGSQCRARVACAGALLRRAPSVPTLDLDTTRRFSQQVTQCAHRCTVELAVERAAKATPPAPRPRGSTGIRAPGDARGLPGYPGPKGRASDVRRFLQLRCQELACAKLSLKAGKGSDGAAVVSFLRTCADACAERLGLEEGQ